MKVIGFFPRCKTGFYTFVFTISLLGFFKYSFSQTVYNGSGYSISYYESAYSYIDYSTYGTATFCGYLASDWTNDKVLKIGPGNIIVTLNTATNYIAFDYGAMDPGETITFVSVNGGGVVSFSTPTSGQSGCITLSTSTLLSSATSGAAGKVVITSTIPFTQIVFSIGGPYQVMKVSNFAVTLPLTFQSFEAKQISNNILLEWNTALEINTDDFVIEHSLNGADWTSVGNVKATGSNKPSTDYKYVHTNPANGINYYRILQRDNDGHFSYSKTIAVNSVTNGSLLKVYPNPAKKESKVAIELVRAGVVSLFDQFGKLIRSEAMQAGTNFMQLPALNAGVYYFKTGGEQCLIVVH